MKKKIVAPKKKKTPGQHRYIGGERGCEAQCENGRCSTPQQMYKHQKTKRHQSRLEIMDLISKALAWRECQPIRKPNTYSKTMSIWKVPNFLKFKIKISNFITGSKIFCPKLAYHDVFPTIRICYLINNTKISLFCHFVQKSNWKRFRGHPFYNISSCCQLDRTSILSSVAAGRSLAPIVIIGPSSLAIYSCTPCHLRFMRLVINRFWKLPKVSFWWKNGTFQIDIVLEYVPNIKFVLL